MHSFIKDEDIFFSSGEVKTEAEGPKTAEMW